MLLRSALGMAIVMMLMGMAQNIWQFLILRALLGLLGGFIPNANALIATQIPRQKSGWALGTLSTGAVSGALLGPLAGGFPCRPLGVAHRLLYDRHGAVYLLPVHPVFNPRKLCSGEQKEMLNAVDVFGSLKNPKLVLSLFVTLIDYPVATGSIAPILTLYVRDPAGNVSNIAFISGMIASVPGIAALLSAPRLGKLGDRIGPEKDSDSCSGYLRAITDPDVIRSDAAAARHSALFAWCRRRRAVTRRTKPLLVYNSTSQISGRIFSYNQSFRDIGNVTGPLIGASVSANYGFRAVFLVTACVVLFNAFYSTISLRRPRHDASADDGGSGKRSVN